MLHWFLMAFSIVLSLSFCVASGIRTQDLGTSSQVSYHLGHRGKVGCQICAFVLSLSLLPRICLGFSHQKSHSLLLMLEAPLWCFLFLLAFCLWHHPGCQETEDFSPSFLPLDWRFCLNGIFGSAGRPSYLRNLFPQNWLVQLSSRACLDLCCWDLCIYSRILIIKDRVNYLSSLLVFFGI